MNLHHLLNRFQDPATEVPSGNGAAPPSEALAAGRREDPDFGDLATSSDDLIPADDVVTPPATVEPPAQVPPAPPAAPGPDSPAQVAPPAAAVPPAEVPPSPSVTPPAQPSPPAPATPEPLAALPAAPPVSFEQHRTNAVAELAKQYQLTAEEAEELRVTPETALPKFAAQLHFEVVMSAVNAIHSQLPQLIQGFMSYDRVRQEANDAFFKRWPQLNDSKHVETVKQAINAYKGANPKADMKDVIEKAGLFAMISLGFNPMPQAPVAAPPPVAPQVPARPIGVGSSGAPLPVPSQGAPQNEIEAIAAAWLAGETD